MRLARLFMCLLVLAAGVRLFAQVPQRLAFEVASITPSGPSSPGHGVGLIQIRAGGQLNGRSISVRELVRAAYRVQDYALADLPKWTTDERFDIDAKANVDLGNPFLAAQTPQPSTLELMLRSLLADRFKLTSHTEKRTSAIYRLAFARSDHRLGPGLQPATVNCQSATGIEARRTVGSDLRPSCGTRIMPGAILGGGATMIQLAAMLSVSLDRLVADQTGEQATFDITLKWTPDPTMPSPPPTPGSAAAIDADRPNIFTAIQEQLGLKLEPARGPVDVLVIDHIERPSED